jgi:hypothetical protein
MARVDEIIPRVDKAWQPAFTRFIDTGEFDPAFEEYLNTNRDAQDAFDQLLDAQAAAFADFNQALSESLNGAHPSGRAPAAPQPAAATPRVEDLAIAVQDVLAAPSRTSYFDKLAQTLSAAQWQELQRAVLDAGARAGKA